MLRTIRLGLATLMVLVVAGSASPAFAVPAGWQSIDVILHADQQPVLLVSGVLATETALPAEGELAVPAGSQLSWIGEVLGGPLSEDPDLEYVKSTANGIDIYRFTMTKARTAQVEVAVNDVVAYDGTLYTSTLGWTASQSVPKVQISQRVPLGTRVAKEATGAVFQPGDATYSYYTKTVQDVQAGDRIDLSFSYAVPAAPGVAAGAAPTSGSDPIAVAILALVVLSIVGVVIFAARRKPTAESVADDEEDAEPDESAAPEDSGATPSGRGLSWSAKRGLIIVGIIVVVIAAASIAGREAVKPKLTGDTISRTLLPGTPCATVDIALAVPEGADPAATADALISALTPLGVVNTVTYNVKTSSLAVGFCESTSSEAAIRKALAPTGLVAQVP